MLVPLPSIQSNLITVFEKQKQMTHKISMGPNQGSAPHTSIYFPISSVSDEGCMWKCILFWALVSIALSMKYQLPSCNRYTVNGSVHMVDTRTHCFSSFIHALRHFVGHQQIISMDPGCLCADIVRNKLQAQIVYTSNGITKLSMSKGSLKVEHKNIHYFCTTHPIWGLKSTHQF